MTAMEVASDEPFVSASGEAWTVCHTRPRCEKKFSRLLDAEEVIHFLPVLESHRRYGPRTKLFTKPLFPGYVFARVPLTRRSRLYQQDLLVRLITVDNEPLLLRQLEDIRRIVRQGVAVALHPLLRQGVQVRVVGGPLAGIEGRVANPAQMHGIVVSVDVLQQGLLVKIPGDHLKVI